MSAKSPELPTRRSAAWGSTQASRASGALAPDSVLLDERPLEQLLYLAQRYATLFEFYALDGSSGGDWTQFFSSDVSFLLANVALTEPRENGNGLLNEGTVDTDTALLKQIYTRAQRINLWYVQTCAYQNANLTRPSTPLYDTLTSIIKVALAPALLIARNHSAWPHVQRSMENASGTTWHAIWQMTPTSLQTATPSAISIASGMQELDAPELTITLSKIAGDFQAADHTLSELAHDYLSEVFAQTDHPPHTALYLAFLQLFRYLQTDLNQFTRRHLDYYYQDVLGLPMRSSTGDSVTLALTLTSMCPEFMLPAGSGFSAGKDAEGRPIQYCSKEAATLNQIQVASLRTLLFGRYNAVPAARAPVDEIDGPVAYANAAPAANSQDGFGMALATPALGWPTFGVPKTVNQPAALTAELGFIVNSPALLLQQGVRDIVLTITLTQDMPLTDAGGTALPSTWWPDALQFFASGSQGWQALYPTQQSPISPQPSQLMFEFSLDAAAPPIVANAALTPDWDTSWPVLKVLLNPDAQPYPYSILSRLQISAVEIEVTATGLTDLQLQNSSGPIATGKPFTPFGVAPMRGMSYQIAHSELAVKSLSLVTVNVDWLNLPLTITPSTPEISQKPSAHPSIVLPNGFPQYYRGYQPYEFTNAMFGAEISMFSGGKWNFQAPQTAAPSTAAPSEPPPAAASTSATDTVIPFPLFTDHRGSLTQTSCYVFQPNMLDWREQAAQQAIATPSQASQRGTIKLDLCAPSYGFGHSLFQQLFAARAIENINAIKANSQKKSIWQSLLAILKWLKSLIPFTKKTSGAASDDPTVVMPNPPFTPTIKTVSLTYTASDILQLDTQFWHVHPFGVAPLGATKTLLPVYDCDGNLYIGLSGVMPSQTLRMHFEFRENPASSVSIGRQATVKQAIKWRYLADNQWQDFAAEDVQSTLQDFTASGIVTLTLPAAIDTSNTLLGSATEDVFWVAACASRAPASYNATIAILTQVVTVTRVVGPNAGIPPLPLAAASITGPTKAIAQLKSVSQPYVSSGGTAAEALQAYRVRVSERLKHKQRAVLPSDYEELVLQAFPSIWQIKCIGPNNSWDFPLTSHIKAGKLVLAVTPLPASPPQSGAPVPSVMLGEIAAFIQKLAPPGISDICVRNLEYDELTVHVQLQLNKGAESVVCINQLNLLIQNLLNPETGDNTIHLDIGCGSRSITSIAGAIKKQSYVAAITELKVAQRRLGSDAVQWLDQSATATCGSPWSVLVGAAQHQITVVSGTNAAIPAGAASNTPGTPGTKSELAKARYWLAIPTGELVGG